MSLHIDPSESRFQLGVTTMDETHREFIELVNRLIDADKPMFIQAFKQLVEHTEAHFEAENLLMKETGFPAIREHRDEHLRVLGELHRIEAKLAIGSSLLGRAYVNDQLPAWFDLHIKTMDSALAAHLINRQVHMGLRYAAE